MKAYKFEILVIDHEEIGKNNITEMLKNVRHLYPSILEIKEAEIGEWYDEHPLNKKETQLEYCKNIFK